jgi:uncharacterized protein (TIGR02646 family)
LLFFEKSQPAPECLAREKVKKNGDYSCGDVLSRLKADFQNKCYICESQPTSINVEHFKPKKDYPELRCDWNNLFYSCVHCNTTKGTAYTDILDCTNLADRVEEKLQYWVEPYPGAHVEITVLEDDSKTELTRALILAVFNGSNELKILTDHKQQEAYNLRKQLLDEIRDFQNYLFEYFEPTSDDEEKAYLRRKIKAHLHQASLFTSFKRWIIRGNDRLKQEFGDYC